MLMTLLDIKVYSAIDGCRCYVLFCDLDCNDSSSSSDNNTNAATIQLPGTLLQRFEALY
ncbi:MAG: hypothetical protein ACJ72Q_16555 [Nitrososphaeraceae archaeon]